MSEVSEPPPAKICPTCGAENNPTEVNCRVCGAGI